MKDPKRRAACEADDCEWLRTYLPEVFFNKFTDDQRKIIEDCGQALRYGTQKCKAAPRGDGKSSVVKYLALKYALARQVRFPLVLSATGNKSRATLDSIKWRLANQKLQDGSVSPLSEDYPLEFAVANYIHPAPARANNVTGNGRRPINVHWKPDWIVLPTWADEEPLGPILLALGITSDSLQGCNIFDQRPDFVMLDDLDSRDSLAAEDGVVAAKIEEIVDKTVAGLGGQSRQLGQFMLCTVTSSDAAAYKYSDPMQKPAWSGERIKAIRKWPDKLDLWDKYIELRQSGKRTLDEYGKAVDPYGREAHQFYLKNRKAMDAGAILSNPYNFNAKILPDGSQTQISGLQRCFDYIADSGRESFDTEHQQDPPSFDDDVDLETLTPYRIQRQVSGLARKVVPPGTTLLTCGVDCGKRSLHWVVRAWVVDDQGIATGYTIDYGIHEIHGTKYGSDEGVDRILFAAILSFIEELDAEDYQNEGGEVFSVARTLIDARWKTDSVYRACKKAGKTVQPVMGFGQSAGCVKPNFHPLQKKTAGKRPGDGFFESRNKNGTWLVCADADRWKLWEEDRWMTAPGKPGCMYLYGESSNDRIMSVDEKNHQAYAKHLTNEFLDEVTKNGKTKKVWKTRSKNNHWKDASYYSDVAARMEGIQVFPSDEKKSRSVKRERMSIADLQAKAKADQKRKATI